MSNTQATLINIEQNKVILSESTSEKTKKYDSSILKRLKSIKFYRLELVRIKKQLDSFRSLYSSPSYDRDSIVQSINANRQEELQLKKIEIERKYQEKITFIECETLYLESLIDDLKNDAQKYVIKRFYLNDAKLEEICTELNYSYPNVKKIKAKGIRNLMTLDNKNVEEAKSVLLQ